MIVTKIERQKRDRDRVNLYIDGEFAFGIHGEVLVRFGLRKGDTLDRETIARLKSVEEFQLARDKALRYISYRLRSEKEVRAKLREKEFPPKTVDETISYLREQGIVNDEAFAAASVKDILMKKPAGRRFLENRLRMKGVSKELAREVVQGSVTDDEEKRLAAEAARKLIKRYGTSRKPVDAEKQRARITSFLVRRGFGWPVVNAVVRSLFSTPADRDFSESDTPGGDM